MQRYRLCLVKTLVRRRSDAARRSCVTSSVSRSRGNATTGQWAGLAAGSLALGYSVAQQHRPFTPSECRPFLGSAKQAPPPRVAVCFCGELRSFQDANSEDPTSYDQVKKLVEAVGPADVFCSVFAPGEETRAMATVQRLLSPKRKQLRPPMEDMQQMEELGKHPDIVVLQACYPKSDPAEAGKQARTNGFVFWGIRHAHRLMVEEEDARGQKYDVVIRMRYDLIFQRFFWTEKGAKKYFAYGLKSPPPAGSQVTSEQLTIFQNIDHEYLKVHKMVEYGHLTAEDTVEEVRKLVNKALDTAGSGEFVTTPAIHTWGGCNDQFGFGTRKAMGAYAGTWDRYRGLIQKKEIHGVTPGFFEELQTEKCLEKTLQNENFGIIRSHKVVARIFRTNGDVSTQ